MSLRPSMAQFRPNFSLKRRGSRPTARCDTPTRRQRRVATSGSIGCVSDDKPAAAPAELSALEGALRTALGSLPRDQVVKSIVSVLPATVFVDESARLHGGRVRKVSV